MTKTIVTKRIFRKVTKQRAKSEINLVKARIRYVKLRNAHEVLKFRTIELHGCRTDRRSLRQLKSKVRKR